MDKISTRMKLAKAPYKPMGRRNPREEADLSHAELARLRGLLIEYMRRTEEANDWLAEQLYLARRK